MRALDDWTGAAVRGRDGRKGRVMQGTTTYVVVHWEDDTTGNVHRALLTMLRPPIGSTGLGHIVNETPAERLDRSGPWWAGLIGLGVLLGLTAWVVYCLSTGGQP